MLIKFKTANISVLYKIINIDKNVLVKSKFKCFWLKKTDDHLFLLKKTILLVELKELFKVRY